MLHLHVSFLHLSAWTLINTCTEKHTFLSTLELWMVVQTPDYNQGHFDHAVVVINLHQVLKTSFKFDMVTDFVEPYDINIKAMGESAFMLVHTPVNYETKRHRLIVSSDAYNTCTCIILEKSVLKAQPLRKSILSIHLETLKLYDHRL